MIYRLIAVLNLTIAASVLSVGALYAQEDGPSSVDFNRDVRPILSNKCFTCHGPDPEKRKAGLRLDDGIGAFQELPSGVNAIVPGDPSRSELVYRIQEEFPEDRMPPLKSGKTLTQAEIDLLVQWIEQGAPWQTHWSFIPPKRPRPPEVSRKGWIRNEIDRFVLARLDQKGMQPSPEAEPETLIRRLSFDLTGLPPSLEEVDQYLKDDSPDAYERLVERLLASPRYGEHFARYWLDLSRYADTNGYHIDNERYMWRWRDWVIDSLNRNMPFDQFTVEQLAGDLLPAPSHSQQIATGFNRNHMINFEGGAIPEEYHVQYVVDRVNTTSTVWLGLTTGCAQCHDHKFDPISQREFYQFYSFFNTVPEKGLDGREGNAEPLMKAPLPDQEKHLENLLKEATQLDKLRSIPVPGLEAGQLKWELGKLENLRNRWVPLKPHAVDLKREEGRQERFVQVVSARTPLNAITAVRLELKGDPEQAASDERLEDFSLREFELTSTPSNEPWNEASVEFLLASSDTDGPDEGLSRVIDGDPDRSWSVEGFVEGRSRALILLPKNLPGGPEGSELRFHIRYQTKGLLKDPDIFRVAVTSDPTFRPADYGPWFVSGPFRADSGEAAFEAIYPPEMEIELDSTYDDGRQKWMKALPQLEEGDTYPLAGEVGATFLYRKIVTPVRKNVQLSFASNNALKVWLNGILVLEKDGKGENRDHQKQVPLELAEGENHLLLKVVNYGGDFAINFRKTYEQAGDLPMNIEAALLLEDSKRDEEQSTAIRDYFLRENSAKWRELDDAYRKKLAEIEEYEKTIPSVMVMAEMEQPRDTFILNRGQYDQPGEKVKPKTPAFLPPLPDSAPRNRLGLARWLTDPGNPLTSRVVTNRLWHHIFGVGIVKTVEDFGVQGELPSHPELLDWLATEFIRRDWDSKALLRLIVTSSTYRQSSKVTPELLAADPENRLLARGPRFRLEAEVIRDTALALAQLLTRTIGGPSVRPYQPEGIWEEVAYGAEYTAQEFRQDTGDGNYRRSMYTFWKRQAPPPNMMLFDAPNRETCTARRERTNTPLQALALLNDQQFVEASRAFAVRILEGTGPELKERLKHGFRLATARYPDETELKILSDLFRSQLEVYSVDSKSAEELLSVGEYRPVTQFHASELAAWTIISSALLNLDETVTKQ